MLALPLSGCMRGDTGNAAKNGVEQRIETQIDENKDCGGDKCPDDGDCRDGKCPDGKCPNDGDCPDGERPARRLPPQGRHGNGRVKPLPCPHIGND